MGAGSRSVTRELGQKVGHGAGKGVGYLDNTCLPASKQGTPRRRPIGRHMRRTESVLNLGALGQGVGRVAERDAVTLVN